MGHRHIATAFAICCAGFAQADEDVTGRLSIELNSVEATESACRMSFVVINGLDEPVDKAVFEAVLFDSDGAVDRLTLFDFGKLPVARPRVRQFLVPELACDGLGRVLINGVETCEAESGGDVCSGSLKLSTRIGVEVIG